MPLTPFRNLFNIKAQLPALAEPDYPCLITDNLAYIERQCYKAVSHGERNSLGDVEFLNEVQQANDADELLNEVLDHLKADNYRVLREFKGSSKITTYITAVISNLVIDLVRKKKGRSRAKERAKSMGTLGEQLYDLVFSRGYSLQNAHGHLVLSHGISEDIDELRGILEKIRGQNEVKVVVDMPYKGKEVLVDGEVEVTVEDPSGNAEELLDDAQRKQRCNRMLDELLEDMDNEDRLIIRMRFPSNDDDEGKSLREIADIIGKTENKTGERIRNILQRCREKLISRGLSLDDLIPKRK